jgi:hypothetical protein
VKNFIDPKKIEEESYVFHELMKEFTPKINQKFESQHIVVQIFTIKWFMTIFSSVLGQEHFYRVFEVYLSEGWPAIFAVGLAFLKVNEEKILGNSFEENLLMINSQLYQVSNIDEFMEEVYRFEISPTLIKTHAATFQKQ